MSYRSKDLQLSLFEGNEAPRVVLATAQMVDLAALVEALLREIATALANGEAIKSRDEAPVWLLTPPSTPACAGV